MFRASSWQERVDFYEDIANAIKGSWYIEETALAIIKAITTEDFPTVRNLIVDTAGDIEEVRKRRHQHSKSGCWCEFGGDEYESISVFPQTKPVQPD